MKRVLIVGGCPRSGTTALTRLLNCHPDVVVGDERYYWLFERGGLGPGLFEADRFFDLREPDRHWDEGRRPLPPGADRRSFARARWVGDKYPPLWRAYGAIAEDLPDARIICILRNPLSVAQSYAARAADSEDAWHFGALRAIDDWNAAVAATLRMVERGRDVHVVSYEDLFAPRADLAPLFAVLELPAAPALPAADAVLSRAESTFARETPRDEALRRLVFLRADTSSYRALSARCLYSGDGPNPGGASRVLSA